MSDREPGFYWVKDSPFPEMTIGRWNGRSWEVMGWHNDIDYQIDDVDVGACILPPDSTPA